MVDLSLLAKAIEEGKRERCLQLTTEAVSSGVSAQDIITHGLQAGMEVVGEKFSSGEYFLPDMLMAARAMTAVLEMLKPSLEKTGIPTIGKVVIGTVEGDMHDIGKNVVIAFLKGCGFEVFDLGVNVPDKRFIDAVTEKKPDILGMSALLTTTMPIMGRVIRVLETAGLRSGVKVIVGGAPVTQDYARYIGADAYAKDGGEAIPICKRLVGK
jgi:5-methyltetrahydrofolate--homocysteine methyltransferase